MPTQPHAPVRPTPAPALLALETSTETLSVAVAAGGTVLEHEAPGGAHTSTHLLPAVLDLLRRAGLRLTDLHAIVFGRGPGAFTGVRTACAVAQGLGFGAGVPLLPVDTLLAVAQDAHARHRATRVLAVLDARMGEVYAARWALVPAADGAPGPGGVWPRWRCLDAAALLRPGQLAPQPGEVLAGNWVASAAPQTLAATHHGLRGAAADGAPAAVLPCVCARPTAAALLQLAPALLDAGLAVPAAQALPLYIRDRVALTTAERLAQQRGAGGV